MKPLKLLMLLFIASSMVFCTQESPMENDSITADRLIDVTSGDCMNVNLMAGQHIDAGDFLVSQNLNGDTVVSYNCENGWQLDAVHLYYGDCAEIPATGSGNPKIGHFPVKQEFVDGSTTFEYTIPNVDGVSFTGCLMAHAVVSNNGQTETAWAEGEDFGGNSWAMYIEYAGCTN